MSLYHFFDYLSISFINIHLLLNPSSFYQKIPICIHLRSLNRLAIAQKFVYEYRDN